MKIAEALALRADLQKRLEQLKQRLVKNARIQEGDKPEEDPVELQSELEKSAQELTLLIQRINRTTKDMFASTFAELQQKFNEVFVKFFPGGRAELRLVEVPADETASWVQVRMI